MPLFTDIYDPREITGYVRAAMRDWPVNRPSLARFLPFKLVDDIEFRFTRGDNGLVQLAPFRAYDTEASISGRRGVTRVSGELPPISRKRVLSEYDRLKKRANPQNVLEESVESDADEIVDEIMMSFEAEIGQALNAGSVTPPCLAETVSFGRSGGNSVTAGTLWSNTGSSDPISDLRAWAKYYRQKNGAEPGVVLMSEDALSYLLQSAAVRSLAANLAGTPTIIDEQTLGQIFTRNRLPQIETYEVQYDDGTGTPTRILPNASVLLLPPPVDPNAPEGTKLGATFVGTPAEADDPDYQLADSGAGLVAGVHRGDDPPSVWTRVSGIGLATLANPDLSMRATVL